MSVNQYIKISAVVQKCIYNDFGIGLKSGYYIFQ